MSFSDLAIFPFVLMGIAIAVLVAASILDAFVGSPIDLAGPGIGQARTALSLFDPLWILITMGIAIFIIASAFLVRSHPLFFILAMLFQIANILLSDITRMVYGQLMTSPQLASAAATFPIMNFTFANMPLISVVVGFMLSIAMFAFPQNQGGTPGS
jgi:hypothetical protein